VSETTTVMCTAGDRASAQAIAAALVEERLAACVQLMPIESWYRWNGEVRHDAEVMLTAKTVRGRLPALEARIRALHPYDLPEIVALPIVGGSADYLAWVAQEVEVEK
jgi:periplasmic divalent cation tolerance protein